MRASAPTDSSKPRRPRGRTSIAATIALLALTGAVQALLPTPAAASLSNSTCIPVDPAQNEPGAEGIDSQTGGPCVIPANEGGGDGSAVEVLPPIDVVATPVDDATVGEVIKVEEKKPCPNFGCLKFIGV